MKSPSMTGIRTFLCTLLLMSGLNSVGQAAISPSQFDITGFIQEATVNTPGNPLSGGTVKVNGHVITVGAGYINFIDYAKGEIRVGGVIGDATTGARVRINDPSGKFGPVSTPDKRFTLDADNPTAQTDLGLMYEAGRGVHQDDNAAVQWCRRAAEQGNALAQYRLGVSYAEGRGVDVDRTEAARWLKNAAGQGLAQAQDYLQSNGL